MSTAEDRAALLRGLELQLLSASVRASPSLVRALLSDDFQEIGSTGDVFGKEEALALLAEEAADQHVYERETRDWNVRDLAENVALVTYRVIRHDVTEGSTVSSLRSSIWTFRDGRWQMAFHQGTRLRTEP